MKKNLLKLAGYVYYKLWSLGLWTPRDRKVLTREIFGLLSNRNMNVLFVGVQKYTAHYENYFVNTHLVSIDIDPQQAPWGFKNHHTGQLPQLADVQPSFYGAIIMNGVIGYGLNSHEECENVILACARLLQPKGMLILGLNPGQTGDVQIKSLIQLERLFKPTPALHDSFQLVVQNEVFSSIEHHFLFYIKQD